MRHAVFAVILALASATVAFAGTDAEKFNKLVGRFAAANNDLKFKPRSACLCLANAQAGYMLQVAALDAPIYCVIPTFTPDGSLDNSSSCPGDYVILGR